MHSARLRLKALSSLTVAWTLHRGYGTRMQRPTTSELIQKESVTLSVEESSYSGSPSSKPSRHSHDGNC